MIIWESGNLVHWSRERSYEIGIPGAGCVWAPETVYDQEKKAFLVFFTFLTRTEQEAETACGLALIKKDT